MAGIEDWANIRLGDLDMYEMMEDLLEDEDDEGDDDGGVTAGL